MELKVTGCLLTQTGPWHRGRGAEAVARAMGSGELPRTVVWPRKSLRPTCERARGLPAVGSAGSAVAARHWLGIPAWSDGATLWPQQGRQVPGERVRKTVLEV
jgi:hypothetical protein